MASEGKPTVAVLYSSGMSLAEHCAEMIIEDLENSGCFTVHYGLMDAVPVSEWANQDIVIFCVDTGGQFLEELVEHGCALDFSELKYGIFAIDSDCSITTIAEALQELLERLGAKELIASACGEVLLTEDQNHPYPAGFHQWLRQLTVACKQKLGKRRISKRALRKRRQRKANALAKRWISHRKLQNVIDALRLSQMKRQACDSTSESSSSELEDPETPQDVYHYVTRRKSFPQSKPEMHGSLQRTEWEVCRADFEAARAKLRKMGWLRLVAKLMLNTRHRT